MSSNLTLNLRLAPNPLPSPNPSLHLTPAPRLPMLSLESITTLHRDCIARWHQHPIDNPYDGFLKIACEQLSYNFRLWHEEDKARSPTATDTEIAQVKLAIDKLNQQRT